MPELDYAILGGGLSGLYAASLLRQRGVSNFCVFEARTRLGGRIESAQPFDLGPTWFWPEMQPQLTQLINELGLTVFAQHEEGDMMVERTANEAPLRMAGYASAPPSMRIQGGMGRLIQALAAPLTNSQRQLNAQVTRLTVVDDRVQGEVTDGSRFSAKHVLLALPPRLAMQSIEFAPALPKALFRQWQDTETWMAPHAKFIAHYAKPFWREQGLSGAARSARGPLVEIHDASNDAQAALFGFVGVPAYLRQRITADEMQAHCLGQLARLFGEDARVPVASYYKDWAQDNFTATTADLSSSGQHPQPPTMRVSEGTWTSRMTGIGAEWSQRFPGYLAGCIDAVQAWSRQSLELD